MAVWKILFKSGGFLTQAADALIWPDQAGYGSDVVRTVDEVVGDPGYLRRLQMVFSRTSTAAIGEDVAICTFDFVKVASDEATNNFLAADYALVESALDTYWGAMKVWWPPTTALKEYRWYVIGPARPLSGPAVRITSKNVAGTGTGTNVLPPQASINVSEHTRIRKHWGRFYLPANLVTASDNYGRPNSTIRGLIHNGAVTAYNACRSGGIFPVVYSEAKPERPKKHGGTLPAAPARAFGVESLVTDDIFDTIRRRRFDTPSARSSTVLT